MTAASARRPAPDVADRSAALAAVSEALLGIAGDLGSDAVLERLVEAARGLSGAQYERYRWHEFGDLHLVLP